MGLVATSKQEGCDGVSIRVKMGHGKTGWKECSGGVTNQWSIMIRPGVCKKNVPSVHGCQLKMPSVKRTGNGAGKKRQKPECRRVRVTKSRKGVPVIENLGRMVAPLQKASKTAAKGRALREAGKARASGLKLKVRTAGIGRNVRRPAAV